MARALRLLKKAWALRHDREALLTGLNRAGVRVIPGAGRYENRSPRVGALVNDAWAGHVTRSLAELERLASASGRETRDASIALADWDITHQNPARAAERLAHSRRLPRDGRVLLAEARRLIGPPPSDPLAEVNSRLTRAKFAPVASSNGTLSGLTAPSASTIDGPLVTVIVLGTESVSVKQRF